MVSMISTMMSISIIPTVMIMIVIVVIVISFVFVLLEGLSDFGIYLSSRHSRAIRAAGIFARPSLGVTWLFLSIGGPLKGV